MLGIKKPILAAVLAVSVSCGFMGCSNVNETDPNSPEHRWGDSKAMGGTFDTMSECKTGLHATADLHGYKYVVSLDQQDYYSVNLIDNVNGVRTGYIAVCDKKKDHYFGMFEIPPKR